MPIIYKNGNIYGGASSADDVSFDDTTSGLSATNVQDAIDELAQGGGGGTAATTTYDNTESGLNADNVQEAIDEVVEDKADRVALPPDYDATSTYAHGDMVTYQGDVYQCNTVISTAEAWNSAHWTLVTPDTDYLHSINPNGNGSFSLNRKVNTTVGRCSFAEGYDCTASGDYGSHAEGYKTIASSSSTHAEGYNTTASGIQCHAEGYYTTASGGNGSHAEGRYTTASGTSSHSEGSHTTASGNFSHSEGLYTTAKHQSQHTFGEYNALDTSTAGYYERGNYVEIVGNGTATDARSNARTLDWSGNEVLSGSLKINGTQDVATQVSLTQAEYDALVSAGTVDLVNTIYFITDANATACSASEVTYSNTSSGLSATAVQGAIDEVVSEKADRVPLPTEYDSTATYNVGDFCTHDNNIYLCSSKITTPEVWTSNHWTLCNAQQDYLHSLNPVGNGSFSLNRKKGTTIGELSFAGGANVTASGYISYAEGNNTVASGSYSHAEGFVTTASGTCSHAEGYNTTASSSYSHAEGYSTTANGGYSHAEGSLTIASGTKSHAEGDGTTASGGNSHAEGSVTTASGSFSHAEGLYTTANHKSQHTFGEYNVLDDSTAANTQRGNYIEIVGNGTATNARSNARTLDWSGNEVLAGTLTASGLVSPTITALTTNRAYAYRKTSTVSFTNACPTDLSVSAGLGPFLDNNVHMQRANFDPNIINYIKGAAGGAIMFATIYVHNSNYYCGSVHCYHTDNEIYGGFGFVNFQYMNGTFAVNYISQTPAT